MPASKLVLVDGSAMMYRAYYKLPGELRTSSGVPTNATYGFALMFRKLFAGRKPERGAVVFDPPGRTFRDERYAEYKADRSPMPDNLSVQIPHILRVVEAFNFPHFRVQGYEADDVIGTLTRQAQERGHEVLIVSGDKDFCQLVDEGVRMLDAMREITYDVELVRKKWGVPPARFTDLLALLGDKIDNVPGVAGIGQKTAAELIERYGSLEAMYEALDQLPNRAQKALTEHRDTAFLSKELVTIDKDVPLDRSLDDLVLRPPDPDHLNAVFKELEFYSLLSDEKKAEDEVGDADYFVTDVRTLDEDLKSRDTEEAFISVEPLYSDAPAGVADLVGLSFGVAPGRALYLPLAPKAAIPEPIRAFLQSPNRPKVVHDGKPLIQLLAARGVELAGVRGDTMLASFLVDPNKLIPHRLDQVSKEYLQRTLRPMKRLVGSGQAQKSLRDVPQEAAAAHAGHRADAIRQAWPRLQTALDRAGQEDHLHRHELPLSWVLARMESHGILVDPDDLAQLGQEFAQRLSEVEREVHGLAGRPFNLASTKQLSQVLFEELKLPVLKRTKTGYSTAVDVLEKLAKDHPIARLLLEHRKLSKLISTYTNVLQACIRPETGRVHANFQQTASQTGRLISTDPDLQRTPIRTPEGRRIRKAFVAPDGHCILSADWSQIELRILAHVSEDPLLLESFQAGTDVHRRTAGELFHIPPEDVSAEQRNVGKTVNFATVYGQGATALGQILGIPRREAEGIIQRYFERYSGVRTWLDRTIEQAMQNGFVRTLFGRIRRIPELSSNSALDVQTGQRIAANTPIQGSAADLCKEAMLRIDASLNAGGFRSRLVLQIHDELLLECPNEEVDSVSVLVKQHMESVTELRVPLVAQVGHGASWADAH